jgi:hypothetical protein
MVIFLQEGKRCKVTASYACIQQAFGLTFNGPHRVISQKTDILKSFESRYINITCKQAVCVQSTIFYDMKPCDLVKTYRRFGIRSTFKF